MPHHKTTQRKRKRNQSMGLGDKVMDDLYYLKRKRPEAYKIILPRLKKLVISPKKQKVHCAAGFGFFRFSKESSTVQVLVGKDHKGVYKLPGGKAEDGEDPWTTACRELREETGTSVLPLKWFHTGDGGNGRVCLRSFYYKPSRYTLFIWMDFHKEISFDDFSILTRNKSSELKSLEWLPVNDPALTPWIKTMLATKDVYDLLETLRPKCKK